MPTNPDAVYLGHMASAVARIAEFVDRVPKLIHDYFEVDLDVVWRTATVNVPEVADFLRSALGNEGS
ncbi:MAG: DUF86 domain-containing protein [Longimicrobiales bacterium]